MPDKGKKIVVTPPEGFVMPEGKGEPDDTIQLLDTWRVEEGGKLCLVEFDGHAMPGYGDKDEEKDTRSYSEAAASHMDAEQARSNPQQGTTYA